MVTIKTIKIQENDRSYKNCKKTVKIQLLIKKMLERSSDEPSNYPRCVL